MGQHHSAVPRQVSPEQLSQELAHRFAATCYSELELYCYKGVFRNLADAESEVKYWSEATLCQFLGIPDVLGAGPIVYQMATYLGAFPFPSQAPCILTRESMIKVITLMTKRHKGVLKGGSQHRVQLLFGSLAVFDRRASQAALPKPEEGVGEALSQALRGVSGFSIDEASAEAVEGHGSDNTEGQLSIAALDSMDPVQVISLPKQPRIQDLVIPSDNFLKLVELLLLVAPLDAQDSVSQYSNRLSDKGLESLRQTANNILAAFDVENQPGIPYTSFEAVVESSLPYLFDPLSPLFERFLFQESLDLSKPKDLTLSASSDSPAVNAEERPSKESLVPSGGSPDLLTDAMLSQLSFFIPPTTLFHRLNHLYSGSQHGFSMGSFEKYVFNWHAPTILLVSGTLLPTTPSSTRERTFLSSLPPARFPSSTHPSRRVTYGALIPSPWQQTPRAPFGSSDTLLFQLAPTHHVFRASSVSTDYISFLPSSPTTPHAGVGIGTKLTTTRTSSHSGTVPVGPVSLFLDDALEFGCFTHSAAGGGSFGVAAGGAAADWQDRFEIEALEVYGLGGEKEAERQRRALEFEENEARRRREGGVGTGDVDADRELLKMAGLIGGHESGGSMG